MRKNKTRRFLFVFLFFALVSLACDGDTILRTARSWLCKNTGGVWVQVGITQQGPEPDVYYYCDRGGEQTENYASQITDDLHDITTDEETPYGTNLYGDWHGAVCPETEGTFQYEWAVNLFMDPVKNLVVGTVKFHDCPGGGRVLYSVKGEIVTESLIQLDGSKQTGAGDLFNNSPDNQVFKFDPLLGQLVP